MYIYNQHHTCVWVCVFFILFVRFLSWRTHLEKDLATWFVRPDTSARRAEAVTSAS